MLSDLTVNASAPARRTISDKYRATYPEDVDTLQATLARSLSGTSDVVTEYEQALSGWFGARHAVALSSGGAALSVALHAVGVEPGDNVLLTPSCPLCTVYPIIAAGAVPVFVDTRAHGFGADPDSVRASMTPRTRALIDIPMWGYPTEVDALQAITRELGIKLILDLAHSHGTTLHGQPLSHFGDVSCFSTHERKLLATGEGGFLLTDDDVLAKRSRDYSRFGNLNGKDFGLNYKLAALPAALGKNRLRSLAAQIDKRRENARYLLERIHHPQVREKTIVAGGVPNYYFLNLELRFADNAAFIDYLDDLGVPSDIKRYGCKALYEFPALERYRTACPNAQALLAGMTTIPVHPGITVDELDYIAACINRYEAI